MKVLLISPPHHNMLPPPEPAELEEEEGTYPPLGLMYIAAYLEKYSDHQVEILDTQVDNLSYEEIEKIISEKSPDIVGIQATTFTLKDAVLTANLVKKINKNIHVAIGGPHIDLYPNETAGLESVDSVIRGEGEITFVGLANALSKNMPLEGIKGIIFKKDGEIINNGERPFVNNLDELPFPARHLLPYKKYFSGVSGKQFITTMMTSRGCPFNCLFCYTKNRVFRARSPDNVINEIKECIKMGITEFELYDDTFTVDKNRSLEIAQKIIDENLKITWGCRARINTVDENLLRTFKKAGCVRINYGIESGNAEILKKIRKGITLEQIEEVLKLTQKIGITSIAYFMIGFPEESKSQILETINFAKKIDPDYCLFCITVPYPSTDIYKMGLESGLYKEDYWKKFASNPLQEFTPRIWDKELSEQELKELLKYAYHSFYVRPKYILKRFLKLRSIYEFNRLAKTGLKILFFKNK